MRRQGGLLARAQVGRDFDDAVVGGHAERVQPGQHAVGQGAGAGAEFQYGGRAGVGQHLRHLPGHGVTEQWRQFRRGDEIARRDGHAARIHGRRGQLERAGGVIAQARRIKRLRHPLIERQPAARRADGLAQVGGGARAVARAVRVESGEGGSGRALHGRYCPMPPLPCGLAAARAAGFAVVLGRAAGALRERLGRRPEAPGTALGATKIAFAARLTGLEFTAGLDFATGLEAPARLELTARLEFTARLELATRLEFDARLELAAPGAVAVRARFVPGRRAGVALGAPVAVLRALAKGAGGPEIALAGRTRGALVAAAPAAFARLELAAEAALAGLGVMAAPADLALRIGAEAPALARLRAIAAETSGALAERLAATAG